ncbi:MAG: ATP-dependent RNA helicase [Armatimonadetes bacterium]|nr:ATP-dependent RNA helicase [Armatimonadota bacterium]
MSHLPELPVDILRDAVLKEAARRPLIISALTGSGKSTRVPIWCYEALKKPVLVVEPRRVACRSLARWVSQQQADALGRSAGYVVRFEEAATEETAVRYVTPGVALRYGAEGQLSRYGAVILDEFHERGLESDLFLAICRSVRPGQPLVIMSATLQAEKLVAYTDGLLLEAEGRVHPVEVAYLGGPMVPSSWHLADRVAQAVRRAVQETDGSVLVFLPGKGEIGECADRLRGLKGIEPIPLHGDLTNREQDRAFETEGRRVILATNVAETSVTLPGITAVVDSGLVRQRIHRARRAVLAVVPISRASAEQRRGRAGRLSPGVCYRLWDERGILEPVTPPEILRQQLTDFVLTVAAAGFQPQNLHFLDAPPDFAVRQAQEQLVEWGALTPDGKLTDLGRGMFRTPVASAYARLLVAAPPELRRDLIDLIAALERPAPLLRSLDSLPGDAAEGVREARKKELLALHCDASALILTLRQGRPARHHLHREAWEECRRIAGQLRGLWQLPPLDQDSGPAWPDRKTLARFLLQEWPDAAYVRRQKGHAWTNGQEEVALDASSLLDPEASAALFLAKEAISGEKLQVRLRTRTAMPVTFADLANAGLGEPSAESVVIERGQIMGEVALRYGGRELIRDRRPLDGALLRMAMVSLIRENRLLPGLWKGLTDRIETYNLKLALENSPTSAVDAPQWLLSRLESLGIESNEDIPLLLPEDLAFAELSDDDFQAVRQKYPATFSTGNAVFAVEYDPARRQVILYWKSGFRHTAIGQQMLPRWNHWSVLLHERGRVTTVR